MKEKPFIMIRLKEPDYETPQAREKFISIMKNSGKAVDSIALFIGNIHNFLPYKELLPRLPAVDEAIIEIRKELKTFTGINLLSTIGHLEEADCWQLGKIPPMINYNGKICSYTPCPSSSEFLEDTAKKYREIAKLNPDFIWIDDDFRMHNHRPAILGCFCNNCLKKFSEISGKRYTREELVSILSENTEESENLRRKWFIWCDEVLKNIAMIIEKEVHKVNPDIIISLMFCGGFVYNFSEFLNIIRKKTEYTFIRPGGGFYIDSYPFGFIMKAIEYSKQISIARVKKNDKILAEIENFPYNFPLKSLRIFSSEITASIAGGCSGATVNISNMIPDTFHEYRRFLETIEKKYDFWKNLSYEVKNLPLSGAYLSPDSNHFTFKKYMNLKTPQIFGNPVNLTMCGIPLTGEQKSGLFSILTYNIIDGMNEEQLKKILSKSAMVDASAVGYIQKKGLSNLIGVEIENEIKTHCIEEYLENEINDGFAGKFRDSRPKFFEKPSYVFRCVSEKAIPICRLRSDYKNGKIFGYSTVIFENEYGAKVSCFGYDPWEYIFSENKIKQIHNIVSWLTDGKFPFIILFPPRIVPFLRYGKEEKAIIVMINASFDDVNEINFRVKVNFSKSEILDENGKWVRCEIIHKGKIMTLKRKLLPWDCLVLKLYS
jgi:hypothetical protein